MYKMILAKRIREYADGTTQRVPLVRARAYRTGPVMEERTLRTKQDILICGAAISGKSRYLAKLTDKSAEIWGKNTMVVSYHCRDNLSVLLDSYGGRGQNEKLKAMIEKIKERKTVLLLDDAHVLAGKKLNTINRLIEHVEIIVSTCSEAQRIPASLRLILLKRNPQEVQLNSDQPFDATNTLMWLVILISIASGAWQLAAVLGATKFIAHSNRSTKQSN